MSHAVAMVIFISFCFLLSQHLSKTCALSVQHCPAWSTCFRTALRHTYAPYRTHSLQTQTLIQLACRLPNKQCFITKHPTDFTNVTHLQIFSVPIFFSIKDFHGSLSTIEPYRLRRHFLARQSRFTPQLFSPTRDTKSTSFALRSSFLHYQQTCSSASGQKDVWCSLS